MNAHDRLIDSGVVAVLRNIDADAMLDTVEALRAGGVTAFEVTVDATNATDLVSEVTAEFADDEEAVVGAGSVLDAPAARSAIEAGAEFVVGPTLAPDVIETANRYGVLVAPGVMTPTEAIRAAEAGSDLIKVFPAATVGPDHLSAIQAPLGDLPLMPTGGIGPDNVDAFFDAGATVVGAGSALIDYDAIERGDFDAVEDHAAEFVTAVEDAQD
ncbi:bifunctional 4-hydroxy-2-oxoglutarate aldolase/2-dehydro-3-deoxy-phosphogluconate aldolase [Halorhabdus amylolytica]|uniref:bifunctional 4-hydroxy-2-oxoglutarate aldolase/2-dehydro-3-deoxy-phosphogluconate aldolase n=1 Tax=Halorhabdus amylolytica TaxID=2559573 RepID=UPI0010AB3EA3|nr:bifunctional 4-hydroxy-2-oxoglutarate aldolase/2-dehydro-3-deoxy-phosphogluconate aldolase [Halorhabdus amylolytica]